MIKVHDENLVKKIDYASYEKSVSEVSKIIEEKSGPGNDYIGWVDYPSSIKDEDLAEIEKYAEIVRKNYDILLVCGIGGSYLGARAAIEAINGLHSDKKPEIIFVGQSFSSDYLYEVIEHTYETETHLRVFISVIKSFTSRTSAVNCTTPSIATIQTDSFFS